VTSPIVIDEVRPRTPRGLHPAKAALGHRVRISADIYRDGHDVLAGRARWRRAGTRSWTDVPLAADVNDRWEAFIEPPALGVYEFMVEGWTDHLATWRKDIAAKLDAGQDVTLEVQEGTALLEQLGFADAAAALRADGTLPGVDVMAAAAAVVGDDVASSPRYRLLVDRDQAPSSARSRSTSRR